MIIIAGADYIHVVIFRLPPATLHSFPQSNMPTGHPHNVSWLIPTLDAGTRLPALLFLAGKLCLHQLAAGMGGTYFAPRCIYP